MIKPEALTVIPLCEIRTRRVVMANEHPSKLDRSKIAEHAKTLRSELRKNPQLPRKFYCAQVHGSLINRQQNKRSNICENVCVCLCIIAAWQLCKGVSTVYVAASWRIICLPLELRVY